MRDNIIGRTLAVDYGKKRIGLAVCDPEGLIASPAGVLTAAKSTSESAKAVAAWAADNEIQRIVVGLPLNMDGTAGPQAAFTQRFVDALRATCTLPVETWDERLTSFQADEWLAAGNLSPADRKARRDALAATAILRSFLDARQREDDSTE